MTPRVLAPLAGVLLLCSNAGAQPLTAQTPLAWDDYYALQGAAYGPMRLYGDPCACDGCVDHCSCTPPCAPSCGVAPAPVWVLSVGALAMDRNDGSRYTFSYDDPAEDEQHLDQRDAGFDWAPGFEARLTRVDACTGCGTELVYWQLFPSDQHATVLGSDIPGQLSAILNYSQLDYNGVTADNYTDNAFAHRLRRQYQAYNFEANRLLSVGGPCGCGPTVSWVSGFRMFRLEEELSFASDPNDAAFTYETDELYYNIETENLLFGGQMGAYCCCPVGARWSVIAGAKAGVFGNYAHARSHIAGAAGTATINNGPNVGRAWLVDNDKADVATMAELMVGVAYQATPCWRLAADYRVVSVSGVALPTQQIYHDLRGINDVEMLDTDGHVLLHGGFVTLERLF